MNPVTLFWLIYLLPILPAAMGLLWIARRDTEMPERFQGPVALFLAPFWPALVLVFVGAFLHGLAGLVWMVVSDPRTWWRLVMVFTHPIYRVHCWARIRWIVAHAREQAAEPEKTE